jgi:hypothetical protein
VEGLMIGYLENRRIGCHDEILESFMGGEEILLFGLL